ncbi:hypothetical protein GGR24_001440 [Hansschlegelia beijingensis]|uniref:Uncharacterized protein n=1 Tax=Hansschlegelia beijingensis TaxID=1133344 RepID=A0A7W6GF57_9HYPH|nr:hypothetical protein [Hansschlegelia beijingensis]
MTIWEFSAAVDGWKKSQGIEDDLPPPDRAKMLEMLRD